MRIGQSIWQIIGWLGALAVACGAAAPAFGQSPPVISAHSQTEFAVLKGDRLTVEVEASGEALEAKWLKTGAVLCRSLRCEIDTSAWGIGDHKLMFVVFNKKASLSLRFSIRILAAPVGYRPGAVKPPLLQDGEGVERVAAEDLTVRARVGHGYSYYRRKLQVVGPLPRSLDWQETLRTRPGATLRLGREGGEEHVLAPSSTVYLVKAASGRRALALDKGLLRSRNLGAGDPQWSVVAGDWVQVDTDAEGDVLVTRQPPRKLEDPGEEDDAVDDEGGTGGDGDGRGDDGGGGGGDGGDGGDGGGGDGGSSAGREGRSGDGSDGGKGSKAAKVSKMASIDAGSDRVTVTVLRGNARVFVRRAGADAAAGPDAGTAVTVPQGMTLVLRRDGEVPRPSLPDPRLVGAQVLATSPQYVPGQNPVQEGSGHILISSQQPPTMAAALTLAVAANARRDYMMALEALAPFAQEAKASYGAQMALGEAAAGIFLDDAAFTALRAAASLDEAAAAPYFVMGQMELALGHWQRASQNFAAADERGYGDQQLLQYYLGVASYNARSRRPARTAFTYSLWAKDDGDVSASARRFRARLASDSWVDVRLGGGLFYDSNVVRSDKLDLAAVAGGALKTRKSPGYTGDFGFSLWPARSGMVTAAVVFDAVNRTYTAPSLRQLTLVDQKLAFNLGLGFGGGVDGPKAVGVEMDALARTILLGGSRAVDEVGSVLAVGSPALKGLRLAVESTLALDPLPARDDVLDPVRWEVVPAGERSCRLVYYDLGFKPVETDHLRVGVDLRHGGAVYRNVFHKDENFTDTSLGVAGTYAPDLREDVAFGLADTIRKFPQAADHRQDGTLALRLGWTWRYTPALSQILDATYESQGSTRSVNQFKREVLGYTLRLDL